MMNTWIASEAPDDDDLVGICWDAYYDAFDGRFLRPYLYTYQHLRHGLLLVACQFTLTNLAGEGVQGRCKYGSTGANEIVDTHWVPLAQKTLNEGVQWVARAVPFVEGGHGKFWISVELESADVFQFFFRTINGVVQTGDSVASDIGVTVGEHEYRQHRARLRATAGQV